MAGSSRSSRAEATPELSEPGLPPPENRLFYPALDGLRAIAVLMVFCWHYFSIRHPALAWGWAGVDIFFVLSGFLITGILYDTRQTRHRFRNFYVRRTLRIVPLYYGVLFLALLSTPIFHWAWNRAWILWWLYLGNYARFISPAHALIGYGVLENLVTKPLSPSSAVLSLGHFWSLCVEEQFYLVWPAIVFGIRRRSTLLRLCILGIPLVLLCRILVVLFASHSIVQQQVLARVTLFRGDAFLMGGIAALLLRGDTAQRTLHLAPRCLASMLTLFAVWELFLRFATPAHHFFFPLAATASLPTLGFTLIDLAAALLVSSLLTQSLLSNLFSAAPLRSLGRISYGFYVFHEIPHTLYVRLVLHLAHRSFFRHQEVVIAMLAFVSTLALATVSYHFYEIPFLRLKARFTP